VDGSEIRRLFITTLGKLNPERRKTVADMKELKKRIHNICSMELLHQKKITKKQKCFVWDNNGAHFKGGNSMISVCDVEALKALLKSFGSNMLDIY